MTGKNLLWAALTILVPTSTALSLSSYSGFHGTAFGWRQNPIHEDSNRAKISGAASLSMRKQKASDRRTRRLQRGSDEIAQEMILENLKNTMTSSPMESVGVWNQKGGSISAQIKEKTGGRGRSRKRATLYNSLSTYHNKFFTLLTDEYRAEVSTFVVFQPC
jgi:hypothetical protein